VHEVVADLDAAVERVLQEALSSGPLALQAAKRLVRERPEGIETARIAARLRSSPEGQEGLRAFLERRPPRHVEALSEPWRSRALEQLRRGRGSR